MIRLSLIVAVLQSHEVVRRQLLHLAGVLTPACELILVDDGSEPPLEPVWASVAKPYAFRGYATGDRRPWTQPRARNLGAALSRADKLLFFDIDHIVTAEVVQAALAYEGDKLHWRRRPAILDAWGMIVTDMEVLRGYGAAGEASPSIHANSFVIRRELFERLGGYDERFCGRYGGDDIDFNARYDGLCEAGLARPAEVRGNGFVYPDPARDVGRVFHTLSREPSPAPRRA